MLNVLWLLFSGEHKQSHCGNSLGPDLGHINPAATVVLGDSVVCGFVQPGEGKMVSLQGD